MSEKKEETTNVKKGKFNIVLIIFSIISMLLCVLAIKNGRIFAGVIAFVMLGLFIVIYLMKSQIIKEPKKGVSTVLAIIAFVLIIPYFGVDDTSNARNEKIIWDDIVMSEAIPEPKRKHGRINSNTGERLDIYIDKSSKEDYLNYTESCKEKGFIIDSKKEASSYDAYNEEGYKLRLYYNNTDKEYNIALEAPIKMKENAWPNNELSKLIPQPKSTLGKVESESARSFTYYAGKTSEEDFGEYAKLVLESGFSEEYQKGDTYFYGKNSDGYRVDIRYSGNKVMKIYIEAPNKEKENASSSSQIENTQPIVENKTEAKTPETIPSSDSNSNEGIGKEFKEAMDSYEEFMNEYVNFMNKYKNLNGSDASLISDYSKYMSKYAEVCKDFEKWESEQMSTDEAAYYIDVQTRINKKLLEVAN